MYSDLEEEYEYEYEYESEFTYDDFLDYYKDDVLYMLEELKSRFTGSPFFMSNVNLPILTDYIMMRIVKKPNKIQNSFIKDSLRIFHTYYKQELEISYNIISKFLKRFKITLEYNSWLYFCYTYTDLYEIKNYF
jgi:hypothetical protein